MTLVKEESSAINCNHPVVQNGVCSTCKVTTTLSDPTLGRKFDGDKLKWDLVPFKEFSEVVSILTTGAKKYAADNWKYVDDAQNRYFSATMRHIISYRTGEKIDPETGKSHLAHAICSLLFLMWFDNNKNDK